MHTPDAPSPSLTGACLTAGASICVIGGALSLIDAAEGWQQVLSTAQEFTKLARTCPGQDTVTGWGDGAVLVLGGISLVLIAYATFGAVRAQRGGQVTALVAVIPISLMWLDSFAVGQSPLGDCDGIGVTGAASATLMRAGWLFFAAIVLCLLSAAVLDPLERHSGHASLRSDSALSAYLMTDGVDRR